MSWVKIWVHLVFSTKNRIAYLNTKNLRFKVFSHIKENATKKNIWLDCVNGYKEHAHCLISLKREQKLSEIAQLIKGESSFWINKNNITTDKFKWQDDYWAVSVSERHLGALRNYIHRQETHHKNGSFMRELKSLNSKYSSLKK